MQNEKTTKLEQDSKNEVPPSQKWGPYLSERAWATVREDYSPNGDPWRFFTYDDARKRAYRWGEDGIGGISDRYQVLCFAPAFWNGNDSHIKERLFGLASHEGNHGEDAKEYYFYLDATPTHSYLKYLYKYPQSAFPYEKLREENQKRSPKDPEYELIDTGVFSENRYFDIFIEYAKSSTEDICIKIEAYNRGDKPHDLHILPQLWFRNQWSWDKSKKKKPKITAGNQTDKYSLLIADDTDLASPKSLAFDYHLGKRYLYASKGGEFLFTENETPKGKGCYKDSINESVVGKINGCNPDRIGTKAAVHYHFQSVPEKGKVTIYLRLSDKTLENPLEEVEDIIAKSKKEADQFYEGIYPAKATEEEKKIQRQAFAGLIWNKQIYLFDVDLWLKGDEEHPPSPSRMSIRNQHWRHLNSMRILLMPDSWEYPWFAAWDLAFHAYTYSLIDLEFGKEQLWLMLFDQFQHPNGQIPAYEWDFSDINPPVQAWVALKIFEREQKVKGKGDYVFLEKCFHKLMMNFTWWVNRVDSSGNNIFEGGFLGLDNITVIERSQGKGGNILHQSDGTGWMAMFSLNLMKMALILSENNLVYESLATKFFEHYVYIAHAMTERECQMWCEKDGFFYDVLRYPAGSYAQLRLRSLVGIIPLFAVEILDTSNKHKFPSFYRSVEWFLQNRPELVERCVFPIEKEGKNYFLLSVVSQDQLKSVLTYVFNEDEFCAPYGLRSLSKYHKEHPFNFEGSAIGYEPQESSDRIKGGNSNWRGPVWFPTSYLFLESLKKFGLLIPIKIANKGSPPVSLMEMFQIFSQNTCNIFKIGKDGYRPFWGENFPFKDNPDWKDYILFYEYFDPDTGRGLGASHQTGWTALIANLIDEMDE